MPVPRGPRGTCRHWRNTQPGSRRPCNDAEVTVVTGRGVEKAEAGDIDGRWDRAEDGGGPRGKGCLGLVRSSVAHSGAFLALGEMVSPGAALLPREH